MSELCTFSINPAGDLQLAGELTFESVAGVFRKTDSILGSATPPDRVDLSSVTHVDSAGLALLLEWQSRRMPSGQPMSFTHAPDSLMSLARLSEAIELLHVSGREAS